MDVQRVASGSPFEESIGFSRAIRVEGRVLVSGTAPVYPDGSCPDDVAEQTRRCLEIVRGAVGQLGADLSDVVRWRAYITDLADAEDVSRVMGDEFGSTRPAATMVVVAGLLDPRWKVEIEAEALVGD